MSKILAALAGTAVAAPVAADAVDINRSPPTLQAAVEAAILGRI
jgi:hypothetical protein